MSLVSRHLEEAGVPTVVMGSARDIVEECGVSRFLYTDFPLGNPAGKPGDIEMQSAITGMALDLLERAWKPRTTVQTPFVWDPETNDYWREHFMKVDESNQDALAAAGEQRRIAQATVRSEGLGRG
ncbi:MAG: hypothetical protein H2035_03555 [Acidimicrobiales bacterium]|nr:hypothetical protein [Acidimicrobiaceae bacterium]MBA4812600.1 hypothetical protein [Acidimicrobiales bacterium]RPH17328.1 MAG: hypothetical protein CBE30_005590 [Actinobacteria bacterium TMED270]RPH17702.1 MAG: hypothetical protein CBE30_003925 [Actinobacteria bacterium TMED270]